ncbi:CATRA conflict system CASPASE/TPR repeat-associated protein [Sphaerisporangium sp. NPDC051011]|uniref:CATRA conflict system CASPASE/TPR repeat-associated protein n=1 Tax=Sphaerisporangium sp. NPDC051011 TaxID=3155792 RepID=UPI0033DEF746
MEGWDFIVHLFALPEDERDLLRILSLWDACAHRLGMTSPIADAGLPSDPPPGKPGPAADTTLAARQDTTGSRQCVLRVIGGFPNLSLALSGTEPQAWEEATRLWQEASARNADGLLGSVRIHLARLTGLGAAPSAETARDLAALCGLPGAGWFGQGTRTADGFHLWEPTAERGGDAHRDFLVAAGAHRDREVSAWLWSDGGPQPPPFARYLLNAAKIRQQLRLWESSHRPRTRVERMTEDLVGEVPGGTRLERLRRGRADLIATADDLAVMRTAVRRSADNIVAAVPRERSTGPVQADLKRAEWFLRHLDADLEAIKAGRERTERVIEELTGTARRPLAEPDGTRAHDDPPAGKRHNVFVVHGRDRRLRDAFFDFLRALDLRPLEWNQLVRLSGDASPFLGEVVVRAPDHTQAALVLLSPDDVVSLHPELHKADEDPFEVRPTCQPRPNVLIELGIALGSYPDRTVIVHVGRHKPIADLNGRTYLRFDGSATALGKIVEALKAAGCAVDDTGMDWRNPTRFSSITAYTREPPGS